VALETAPASQGSTGNWRITYVPTGSNPLSAAILVGGTSKDFTYGFTPDGFNRVFNENSVEDPRLTMSQVLSRPGSYTETLEVTYVESATAGSPSVVLVNGLTGFLAIRRGLANSTVWTAAQTADVITFVAGQRRPNPPTANGIDTISQTLYLTAVTQSAATIIA
jgi:hypothetical protein